MKKGTLITNAFVSGEGQQHQVMRLTEEFAKRNVALDIRRNYDTAYIANGNVCVNLHNTDFVIYLDKDYHIAALLQSAGIRLFNSAECLRIADDKMATYITMCGKGIAMPTTISSPLNYATTFSNVEFLDGVESKLSYPIIVKQCHGSMGKQVYLAHNRQQTEELYTSLRHLPHLYQQYIATSSGRDTRIILTGGEIVASMQRINDNDYRSNIETGGYGKQCALSQEYIAFAKRVANVIRADYCGIDVLEGKTGEPILCEVNCNAFYKGIEAVTGINVAGIYADYILQQIS